MSRLFFTLALLCSTVSAFAQADERVVYSSVVDNDGEPVLNLTASDFVVREDGQAREILRVAKDDGPLQIALLVDNSVSMRPQLAQLRRAALAFVEATRADAQLGLITLAERPTVAVSYTTDKAVLRKAAEGMFSWEAGSYLLDGVAETSQGLTRRTSARSVIAVITGLGPEMSYRQYTEVLRFFRESGAAMHVIQLGTGLGSRPREIVISSGTSETGGRWERVLSPQGLEIKARQLATEISNQYRITYARPPRLVPPKEIEVGVKRPELTARTTAVRDK